MSRIEAELVQLGNSAEIFNFLSDLPLAVDDFEILSFSKFENLSANKVEQERKRLASKVALDSSKFSSIGKRVKKRTTQKQDANKRKASVLKSFFGDIAGPDDLKNKNVRQTGYILHYTLVFILKSIISSSCFGWNMNQESIYLTQSYNFHQISEILLSGVGNIKYRFS